MQQTLYGRKKKGQSRFVVVAPHGIDDLFTDVLAEKLGELLGASIIINDTFMKSGNPLAEKNMDKVQDFSKFPWNSDKNTYIYEPESIGLSCFCQDILEYTERIEKNLESIPVFLYIHGLKDREYIGLDLGIGVRLHEKNLINAREYAEIFLSPENTTPGGSVIADVRRIIQLKKYWNNRLQEEKGYTTQVGKIFFTGCPEQLPQIHKNLLYQIESIQIEINRSLREDINYTVNIIYEGIILHY